MSAMQSTRKRDGSVSRERDEAAEGGGTETLGHVITFWASKIQAHGPSPISEAPKCLNHHDRKLRLVFQVFIQLEVLVALLPIWLYLFPKIKSIEKISRPNAILRFCPQ